MAADICSFWSSLVEENGLGASLQNLSSLKDAEEKSISLLSRVLFLISMSVKHKKDEISNQHLELKQDIENILEDSPQDSCHNCQKLKSKLKRRLNGKSSEKKNPDFALNYPKKRSKTLSPEDASGSLIKIKKLACPVWEENAAKHRIIYARETQAPVREPPKSTERVIVPETIDPNDAMLKDAYGDTDIFELTSESSSPPADEPATVGSPILGKAKWTTPTLVHKRRSLIPSLEACLDKPARTEQLGKVPSPAVPPTSPIAGNQGCSQDPVTPSPSLLGTCRMPALPHYEEVTSPKDPFPLSAAARKPFEKAKSEFMTSEQTKKPLLRASTSLKNSCNYEYYFDRKPAPKMKLKQTKITANSFSKKANIAELTGGGTLRNAIDDENLTEKNKCLLQLGIQLSLNDQDDQSFETSKARKGGRYPKVVTPPKGKASKSPKNGVWLNTTSLHKGATTPSTPKSKTASDANTASRNKGNSPQLHSSPAKSSPKVSRNLSKSYSPNLKSPKSPVLKMRSSHSKISKASPKISKISPKGKPGSPAKSSRLNSSKMSESEILAELNLDSQEAFELPKPNFKKRKVIKSPPKFDDSFDFPKNAEAAEPGYAYKGEVVRRKNSRQQLPGWFCHECKGYYEGCSESQKKRMLNACSKHRSKHKVLTNTPAGFWNPDWEDTVPPAEDKDEFDI